MDLQLTQKLDFITKGLSWRVKGSYNSQFDVYKQGSASVATYTPVYQGLDAEGNSTYLYRKNGDTTEPSYAESRGKARDWYFETAFNYNRTFGMHTVGALALYNQSKTYYPSGSYSDIPHGYVGLVGRVTYDWNNRYIAEFKKLRSIEPPYTNWFLFSSIIESFIAKAAGLKEYDDYRVMTTIRKVEEWYVGDGWYADGPVFAFDYYSSYVFHSMFLETLQNMIDAKANTRLEYKKYYDRALKRAQKYSIILERFISPEGTFPVFGRSIPYRLAALQPLALVAWYQKLPSDLSNGQVRAALTVVMHRMYDQQQNYNAGGFLTIGFCGHQPEVADWYTNNGSLYLTSLSLMPLGLPATHDFWTCPAEPWTQVKAWNGQSFPKDHRWADDIQTKDRW